MIEIEKGFYIKKSNRIHKKYDIYIKDDNKLKYLLSFGDNRYQQYMDNTGLNIYTKLNHLDKERRNKYYQRHGLTKNKKSAKYWSNKYLW
jgi:hypothetical protein